MLGDQGMVLLCSKWLEDAITRSLLANQWFWADRFLNKESWKGVGSRNLLPSISQTYPFLRFSGLKVSKRDGFEKSSPTSFSNLPFFEVFQGWKHQKGVGLRNLVSSNFLQTTTFPGHFLQKGGLSFEFGPRGLTDRVLVLASGYRVSNPTQAQISQTYPFLRFSGLKLSKRDGFEKSFPTSFSNLPFFEVFRAESTKKG